AAATPIARATLSQTRAEVGEVIRLEIKVEDVQKSANAPQIAVNGLEISYYAPTESTTVTWQNGKIPSSKQITHTYQVVPRREGTFTIPPVELEADGQRIRTQELRLTVAPGGAG